MVAEIIAYTGIGLCYLIIVCLLVFASHIIPKKYVDLF